jgi:hypothetical protein
VQVRRVAVTAFTLIVGLLLSTPSAWAICDPGRQKNYFTGSRFDGVLCGGDSACYNFGVPTDAELTIPGYTPFVDFGGGGTSASWAMTPDQQLSHFIQVGNVELWHPVSEPFYEAEWDPNHINGPHEIYPNPGPAGAHHLKVQYSGCGAGACPPQGYGGYFTLIMDVTGIINGAWLPWGPPRQTQNMVEVKALDDQDYGGYSAHQQFSQMTECDWINNANFCYRQSQFQSAKSYNASRSQPWLQFAFNDVSHSDFQVWDTDCSW